jgi:hypothetical protein
MLNPTIKLAIFSKNGSNGYDYIAVTCGVDLPK